MPHRAGMELAAPRCRPVSNQKSGSHPEEFTPKKQQNPGGMGKAPCLQLLSVCAAFAEISPAGEPPRFVSCRHFWPFGHKFGPEGTKTQRPGGSQTCGGLRAEIGSCPATSSPPVVFIPMGDFLQTLGFFWRKERGPRAHGVASAARRCSRARIKQPGAARDAWGRCRGRYLLSGKPPALVFPPWGAGGGGSILGSAPPQEKAQASAGPGAAPRGRELFG